VPAGNEPGVKPRQVNVFLGHPALLLLNTPRQYITRMPINNELPAFWLAAGGQDKGDVAAAVNFRQLLETRLASVPLFLVPGGGHQGNVWRAALVPMLNWMTPQLAAQAARADTAAARAAARAAAARAAAARKAHSAPPHPAGSHATARKP
jgi:hypothetical protein